MSLAPSSPRLPSPPPPAEIQIGPKSPSMGPNAARQAQQIEQTAMDANSKRRIHPGTKSSDMAAGPPLIPLHEVCKYNSSLKLSTCFAPSLHTAHIDTRSNQLDSAFQLQEHLAALHYYHTVSNTSPVTRETAKMLATPPPGTDKTLWLYELCRFLIGQCNSLIVGFLFDTPPCSAATCPEMRASEWQFLCAVHDAPKSCCAIDYCCHTLDWAANVVTNAKIFPSRFVVDSHDKNTALKNLVNVFRRLHRIFAHAWFQHRGVFWSVEGQTGLYVFFKTVCDVYDLLPGENYKLPPEAEGLESITTLPENVGGDAKQPGAAPVLLTKAQSQRIELDEHGDYSAGRTNTKRHIKSSPSTGSAVGTVLEADEDDGFDVASRMRRMHISGNGPADEEMEASIPVIVEHRMVDQPPLRPSSVIPISSASATVSEITTASQATTQEPTFPSSQVEASLPDQPQSQPQPDESPVPQSSEVQEAEEQAAPIQAAEAEPEETRAIEPTTVDEVSQEAPQQKEGEEEKAPESSTAPEAAIPEDKTETAAAPPPDETPAETDPSPKIESEPSSSGESGTDDTSSVGSYEILEKENDDKEEQEGETVPSASAGEPEVKPE